MFGFGKKKEEKKEEMKTTDTTQFNEGVIQKPGDRVSKI